MSKFGQNPKGKPYQLPISSLPETVGISVRGFMLCITIAFQSDHHSKLSSNTIAKNRSIEADRFAHRSLDVQRLDVLPVLLQQRDKEVDA